MSIDATVISTDIINVLVCALGLRLYLSSFDETVSQRTATKENIVHDSFY